MPILHSLLLASLASITAAAITWDACDDFDAALECSVLNVPLDYTGLSGNRTLTLQLARLPAVVQPSKGSILLNFGGPGAPSRGSLLALGPTLLGMTGGQHDLVTFDPRGTANTLPFQCYDDFGLLQVSLTQGASNASNVALGSTWAQGTMDAQTCFSTKNETGDLIGTAFVARDMVKIVDELEEDGMLRYWGFSYGTTLGATVAAMFPDRIDKLILDGVQNPHEYYHATADFEEWTDSDKVISGMFTTCFDFPENCALAQEGVTAEALELQFWDLLDQVKEVPVIVGRFKVTYDLLKLVVAYNLYDSASWPALALLLQGLFQSDSTEAMESVISAFYPSTIEGTLSTGRILPVLEGIHCSDRFTRVGSLEEFKPTVDRLYKTSRFMGDTSVVLAAACAQWKFDAKERYQGDFNIETANPILVIGNHYDGHTPLVSAYNVSHGFKGSHVLEVAGYGHSSLAVPSECTIEQVTAYFNDGVLPEHGYICNGTATPYSGLGWDDILSPGLPARKREAPVVSQWGISIPKSYVPGRSLFPY